MAGWNYMTSFKEHIVKGRGQKRNLINGSLDRWLRSTSIVTIPVVNSGLHVVWSKPTLSLWSLPFKSMASIQSKKKKRFCLIAGHFTMPQDSEDSQECQMSRHVPASPGHWGLSWEDCEFKVRWVTLSLNPPYRSSTPKQLLECGTSNTSLRRHRK